jgi:hypothetical protein
MHSADSGPKPLDAPPPASNKTGWKLLLILPYLALCFPAIYARLTPTFMGFPFFYWYQFLLVILTSALLGLVYFQLKDPQAD